MAWIVAAAFICLSFFSSCQKDAKILLREKKSREAAARAELAARELRDEKSAALDSYIQGVSLRERLAQLFVINLEGNEKFFFVERLDDDDAKVKDAPLIPGGYIFFSFNIAKEPEKIAAFTDSVRAFALENGEPAPFLCLDAEGGYVNRLRGVAGPLPENEWVSGNVNPKEAFFLYSLNAIQLRALGFDMNLSPVVEVQNESNQKFLDGRSFGGARQVVEYGSAAVLAYQTNKVGAVLKHFPGNNSVDPHRALPVISFSGVGFDRDVLKPFSELCALRPCGVLMSHALASVDGFGENAAAQTPASLSAFWIKETLRKKAGFEGLVFSDDIFMAALEKNGWPSERAVKAAILAGVNCILMSEKRFVNEWKIVKKLYQSDAAFKTAADDSIKRVFAFKLSAGILEWDFKARTVRPCPAKNFYAGSSLEERMERFYGAKKLNQELVEKYVQE